MSTLERAAKHQAKGMPIGLGVGYDVADVDIALSQTGIVERCQEMADAYLSGALHVDRGVPVPVPAAIPSYCTEATAPGLPCHGALFVPAWSPSVPLLLDPTRATSRDLAWVVLSGGHGGPSGEAGTGRLMGEYVACCEQLARWAHDRGGMTAQLREEILERAEQVGARVALLEATDKQQCLDELLAPGTRVAFTGCSSTTYGARDDEHLRAVCTRAGMEYKSSVSRTRCDVLVAADPASMSGKAKKARAFGKPIISKADFEAWTGETL